MKKILALLLCLALLIGLAACSSPEAEDQVFSLEGISLTLSGDFQQKDAESFFLAVSPSVSVLVERVAFRELTDSDLVPENGVEAFARAYREAGNLSGELRTIEEKLCLDFAQEQNDKTLLSRLYFLQGEDAFWLVEFSVEKVAFPQWEPSILRWASQIQL